MSERYILDHTAFAARRLDISHRPGCPAGISKGLSFFILGDQI